MKKLMCMTVVAIMASNSSVSASATYSAYVGGSL